MQKKKAPITTDELAAMVQRGFTDLATQLASKEHLEVTKREMNDGFAKVNQRLSAIDNRLDIIADHPRRIERLERQVTKIEESLNLKK